MKERTEKKAIFYGAATLTIGMIAAGDDVGLLPSVILLIPTIYCLKEFIKAIEY